MHDSSAQSNYSRRHFQLQSCYLCKHSLREEEHHREISCCQSSASRAHTSRAQNCIIGAEREHIRSDLARQVDESNFPRVEAIINDTNAKREWSENREVLLCCSHTRGDWISLRKWNIYSIYVVSASVYHSFRVLSVSPESESCSKYESTRMSTMIQCSISPYNSLNHRIEQRSRYLTALPFVSQFKCVY